MRTLIQLLEDSARQYPENIYLWEKTKGKYEGMNYRDTVKRVHAFAAGLMDMGLRHGDRVTLLSEGRNDWVISELGILYNGAVNVPLSVRLNGPEEIAFRMKHSESRMAIASKNHLHRILEVADSLPGLETIICMDRIESNDKRVIFFEDILDRGVAFLKNKEKEFRERVSAVRESDDANICYTSGTTADPKGIILTHRNYTANVEQSCSLHAIPSHYCTYAILPWDHSFAHTCAIYSIMKYGASLASVEVGSTPMETLKNIPKNINEIRPSFLLSVPALAKNFRKNIEKGVQDKGKLVNALFRYGLAVAYVYNGNGWNRGKGLRFLLWPVYRLFDLILFKKIRKSFGGRMKFFVGGGALLDIELQRFFYAIGMPMYQGYGLSEASPVISSNSAKKAKMGSSGTIADHMEVKIFDDDGNELPLGQKGEIVVRGENVMKGYWKNESATRETLKNGWLHTGDLGYLDKDGFLFVLGRFKSLLIADDGEKFSPEGIEEAFADNSPFIDQCMLHNNQKPYSVCLLVPSREAVRKYIRESNGNAQPGDILKKIEKELNKYRTGGEYGNMFPQRWLPSAVAILEEGFTEENFLINSSSKMVRPKIAERYSELLDYLYTPEAKNIGNPRNLSAIQNYMSEK